MGRRGHGTRSTRCRVTFAITRQAMSWPSVSAYFTPPYPTPKLDPATPWNDGVREQWLSTLGGNPKRESWIDRLKGLSEIPQSQTGLRLVFNEYGMSTPVPVGVD